MSQDDLSNARPESWRKLPAVGIHSVDLVNGLRQPWEQMVVNVHEAKTHLSRLLQRVAGGEEVIIARAGVPVAKLVPVEMKNKTRPLGFAQGEVWIADDFDAPLSDDLLAGFYGGELPKLVKPPARKRSSKK